MTTRINPTSPVGGINLNEQFKRHQRIAHRLKMANDNNERDDNERDDKLLSKVDGPDCCSNDANSHDRLVDKFNVQLNENANVSKDSGISSILVQMFGNRFSFFLEKISSKIKAKGINFDNDFAGCINSDGSINLFNLKTILEPCKFNTFERYGVLLYFAQKLADENVVCDKAGMHDLINKYANTHYQVLSGCLRNFTGLDATKHNDLITDSYISTIKVDDFRINDIPSLLALINEMEVPLDDADLVTRLLNNRLNEIYTFNGKFDYKVEMCAVLRFEWLVVCLNSLVSFILDWANDNKFKFDMDVVLLTNVLSLLNGQVNKNIVNTIFLKMETIENDPKKFSENEVLFILRGFVAQLPVVFFKDSQVKSKIMMALSSKVEPVSSILSDLIGNEDTRLSLAQEKPRVVETYA